MPITQNTERLTYTPQEAADRLGKSRSWVYAAINQGKLPHRRVMGAILISRARLEEWVNGGGHGHGE